MLDKTFGGQFKIGGFSYFLFLFDLFRCYSRKTKDTIRVVYPQKCTGLDSTPRSVGISFIKFAKISESYDSEIFMHVITRPDYYIRIKSYSLR